MPKTKPKRVIVNSFEVSPELHDRMKRAMETHKGLRCVTRKRSPWLREAVEEKCEKSEKNGKARK